MQNAHFYLHHHPCQKVLVERLIEKLSSEGAGSLFYQSKVLVRNQGMATWIKQQMASSAAQISMQVEFPQPHSFLTNILAPSSVNTEALLWKIYATLPALLEKPSFYTLREYLQHDSPAQQKIKQYQLAAKLAALFDKYLLFRPEWIEKWNCQESALPAPHEKWQRELWAEIGGRDLTHWSQEIDKLHTQIEQHTLPEAVHLFGVSNFAPAYLKFLYTLSSHVPVHIYWLNPVDGYWGDAPSQREWILQNSFNEEVDPFAHNPLIASFGRMGREYAHNIYGGSAYEYLVQEQDFNLPENPEPTTQLESIQQNLRSNSLQHVQAFSDDSVSIHACHSPLREVQVLKNYLLGLSTKQAIDTGDVLVMCTDINAYAPFIETVFGNYQETKDHNPLAFRIADRNSPIDNPNIAILPTIMRLRSSRFTNQDALRILQTPAILHHFKLTKEDIATLTEWIDRNGIRWGFHAQHIEQKIGAKINAHWTWEEGLNRMLLGITMPSDSSGSLAWNEIVPFTDIEGSDTRILASLCDFIQWCKHIYHALGEEYSLAEWIDKTRDWITLGFSDHEDFQQALQLMYKSLESLSPSTEYIDSPIPSSIFSEHFSALLHAEGSPYGFLSGNITFCEMKPMRSIPAETICMLGMNYDAFPRTDSEIQFDLTRHQRLEGDRSSRDDDLYLFLETILSAKKQLFMSYVGFSIKDGTKLPPSTSLQTLIDHTKGLESAVHEEKLHDFDPHYFDSQQPISFDSYLCSAAKQLFLEKSTIPKTAITSNHVTLPESLHIDAFISALTNPSRYFLTHCLQAKAHYTDDPLAENEPIEMNGLTAWGIKNQLLHNDSDPKSLLQKLQQTSALPPENIGKHAYEDYLAAVTPLKTLLPNIQRKEISLSIGNLQFTGSIPVAEVNTSPVVTLASCSNKSVKDQLRLRIYQLLLSSAQGSPVESQLYFLEKNEAKILHLSPDPQYEAHLHALVELFKQAHLSPLPHFPKTAEAYWNAKLKPNDTEEEIRTKRNNAALSKWNDGYQHAGERSDPAIRYFFDVDDPISEAFFTVSETIWAPYLKLQNITLA